MSGILGFAATRSVPQCGAVLGSMFKAIQPAVSAVDYRWTADDGRGGVGVVHPENVGRPAHWAEDAANEIVCVFDGIVYADAAGNEIDTHSTNGAAVLLDGYLRSGPESLGMISGDFNVAWWDARRSRLVLGNDKLGQRLLFYAVHGGKLAFSSLLAGGVAADVISPTVDVDEQHGTYAERRLDELEAF